MAWTLHIPKAILVQTFAIQKMGPIPRAPRKGQIGCASASQPWVSCRVAPLEGAFGCASSWKTPMNLPYSLQIRGLRENLWQGLQRRRLNDGYIESLLQIACIEVLPNASGSAASVLILPNKSNVVPKPTK